MCDVEDLVEFGLELMWVRAKFPDTDHVKGSLQQLRNAFCSEGFSRARRPVHDRNEATALAYAILVRGLGTREVGTNPE